MEASSPVGEAIHRFGTGGVWPAEVMNAYAISGMKEAVTRGGTLTLPSCSSDLDDRVVPDNSFDEAYAIYYHALVRASA